MMQMRRCRTGQKRKSFLHSFSLLHDAQEDHRRGQKRCAVVSISVVGVSYVARSVSMRRTRINPTDSSLFFFFSCSELSGLCCHVSDEREKGSKDSYDERVSRSANTSTMSFYIPTTHPHPSTSVLYAYIPTLLALVYLAPPPLLGLVVPCRRSTHPQRVLDEQF